MHHMPCSLHTSLHIKSVFTVGDPRAKKNEMKIKHFCNL